MLLLFPCKDTSPCVFLFSFLCSYSRFSPLYPCASPLFSLYSFIFFYLCSSSFSFSFVFSLSISLTFFALLCSPLSSPLSFCSLSFFSSSLPLFLKTKIGEGRGWGGHCVAAPPTCGKCGLCRRLFKGKDGDDRGGRRRRHMVPFKITPFLLHFFYLKCMKRRYFSQNTLSHLCGNWCQNASDSKSSL